MNVDVVNAIAAGKERVVTPKWYGLIINMRKFFPGLVDTMLIKMFAPTPKKP